MKNNTKKSKNKANFHDDYNYFFKIIYLCKQDVTEK